MTTTTFEVDEKTSAVYQATLKDESNVAVPGTTLDSLTLTLYEPLSGAIVNSRDQQNVKNQNGVSIDSEGVLIWTISILDTSVVNTNPSAIVTNADGDRIEVHCALFRAVWDGGAKAVNHLVKLNVRNYDKLS